MGVISLAPASDGLALSDDWLVVTAPRREGEGTGVLNGTVGVFMTEKESEESEA